MSYVYTKPNMGPGLVQSLTLIDDGDPFAMADLMAIIEALFSNQAIIDEFVRRRVIEPLSWVPMVVSTLTTNDLVASAWSDDIGTAGSWVLVGNEETVLIPCPATVAIAGTTVTATGLNLQAAFATPNGGGGVVGLDNTTDTNFCDGASWISNLEAADDNLIAGVHDPDSGNDIIVGFNSGTDLVFLYGTTTGTSDLNRSASTFPVPDLGGGVSVAHASATPLNTHVAADGTGRLLCLVSYEGTTSERFDQFISNDGGVTWTATEDVVIVTSRAVTGLAWDSQRSLWVATKGDGRVFTAPAAGASAWTEVATATDLFDDPVINTCGRLVIANGLWLTHLTDEGVVTWSVDGGTTWHRHNVPVTEGTMLAASASRGEYMLGDGTFIAFSSTVRSS